MNTQHMGKTAMQPCPIARSRRKTIARRALQGVGMVGNCRNMREMMPMA